MGNKKKFADNEQRGFIVTLCGTAFVTQQQTVLATTAQEAETKAKGLVNDNAWRYEGLTDDEVEATAKSF